MKARHPFRRAEEDGAVERAARASREETPRTPLSPEEEAALEASVGAVESPMVRRRSRGRYVPIKIAFSV